MRPRARLWFFFAPLLGHLPRVHAQPNIGPSGGPGREGKGEVHVGAGTQGDVTTGSSGPQKKKGADQQGGDTAVPSKSDKRGNDAADGRAARKAGNATTNAAPRGDAADGVRR